MTQAQKEAEYRLDAATKAVLDAINELGIAISLYRKAAGAA